MMKKRRSVDFLFSKGEKAFCSKFKSECIFQVRVKSGGTSGSQLVSGEEKC